jgi:hypothetical protein
MAVVTPDDGQAAVNLMFALQAAGQLDYDLTVEVVDVLGAVLDDITDSVVLGDSPPIVTHTATDTNPGTFTFTTETELVWGADLVRPAMLVIPPPTFSYVDPAGLAPSMAPGDVARFPLGVFLAASPTDDMTDSVAFDVDAYDKTYLLRSEVGDTFSVDESPSTYGAAILSLFTLAGFPEADDGTGHLNADFVQFNPSWAAKVVPLGANMVYPSDDANSYTYLDIVNAVLKASGQRPLWTNRDGLFVIDAITTPRTKAPRWLFSRTPSRWDPDFSAHETIVEQGNVHENDMWNVPNQMIYIQNGLTFDPTHSDGSDGKYVINNHPSDPTHYRAGSDQVTIGRIIKRVIHLDASGTTDLKTQAERDYTDQYAQAETMTLKTAPWPCASHYDVFRYADTGLPRVDIRKVEVQHWELPLDGTTDMTWSVSVVGDDI